MFRPAAIISAFLGTYRRRRLRLELWAAGLWLTGLALACALGALVVFGWFDGPGALRVLIWTLFAGGAVGLLVRHGLGPRLRLPPAGVGLAREVERGLGDERLELVSAVQLRDGVRAGAGSAGVSAGLIEAHLVRVAGQLADRDAVRLLPLRRLQAPALAAAGLLLAVGSAWLAWPEPFVRGLGALLAPVVPADGPKSDLRESWVGDIELEYRFPAYSGRPDRTDQGTDGAILALPGTQISLMARADRPIAQGSLRLGADELLLRVSQDRSLSTQLVVSEPGSYRFELVDAQGEHWRSPRGHPIQVETDRPPQVQLNRPAQDLVVREDEAIDLLYDARDDFGLDEVRLVWRIVGREGAGEHRVLQRLAGQGARASRQHHRWDLAGLKLGPGDQLQFYVEAVDNDTVRGPKAGRSATVTAKVFSADEHHRELMSQLQQWWEQLLAGLAAHLEQEPDTELPDRAASAGAEPLAPSEALQKGLAELVQRADQLGMALRQDRLAWAPLVEGLDNIRQGLGRHAEQVGWLLRSARRKRAEQVEPDLRGLATFRGRGIERLELDVLYLEDLLDLERLEDLDRIAQQLERAQRRLAELLERYRQAPDQETRRQIEAQIALLKQHIAQLLDRQSEVLRAVRDEYLNPEALEKLAAQRDVMSALDKIQALMMEGKTDQALAELDRLRKQIEQLQQAIDQSRQNFGQGRYKELAEAVARLQGELNQIAEHQRQLEQQTGQLREQVDQRLDKRADGRLKAELEHIRKRLAALLSKVEGIDPQRLDLYGARDRDRALEQGRLLDKLIEAVDLARSLEAGAGLALATEGLKGALAGSGETDPAGRMIGWARDAREAADEAVAIHEALRKLLPSGREVLQAGEVEQLRAMQRRQQELETRLGKLRSEIRRLNEKAPLFGQPMFGGLERSSRSMHQATGELGRLDPRSAHPHQQDALSELERLQQAMQQSCQRPGAGGGMPLPMGHGTAHGRGEDHGGPGRPNLESVEIPGEEDHQAPEAFRKELLEGMKDPVPEDYQPQVRRYYEELVR